MPSLLRRRLGKLLWELLYEPFLIFWRRDYSLEMSVNKSVIGKDMKTIQEDILPATASNSNSENLSDSANNHPIRFRFLRAFGVTFGILISLGFFHLLGKFFGTEWENSRRPAVYGKNAQRLKRLLLSLQGIFIKAGQLISMLSNFLPDYFRKELEELPQRAGQRSKPVICRIR